MSARPKRKKRRTRAETLRQWRFATLAVAAAAMAVYVVNVAFAEIAPDNAWGLTYGVLATVAMTAVALYAARRRTMQRDLGRSRTWLLVHVYGGGLFFLFVLMHSGFSAPRGALNTLLWVLSVWVSVSGAIGVLLQRWIPRLLSSGLMVEAVYERIPKLIGDMREESEELVDGASEPLRRLYETSIAPAMAGVAPRPIYYIDITGGAAARLRGWGYVGEMLSAAEQPKLARLTTLYRSKLELDAQYTLQRTLRWWLYTHIPASVLLVAAVFLHLYVVIRY